MSRIINIYHPNRQNIVANYENVNISDINNIINYSTDFIKFESLLLFDKETGEIILKTLIEKLRQGGSFMVSLLNIKLICRLYSDSIISEKQLLDNVQDLKSIWSVDTIIEYLSKTHPEITVSKIQQNNDNHYYNITFTRTAL